MAGWSRDQEVAKVLCGDGLSAEPRYRPAFIRLHLSMCEFCSRFSRQKDRICEALKTSWSDPEGQDVEAFKHKALERLRSR